ncbi:hypothetical protein BDV18DRAFT_24318 [Aspergillus unguis]
MPPPQSGSKPEKNMSSRLLTMKFMQRAAASAASKESSQPASPSESTGSTPKKRRLSGASEKSPATPQSDLQAISAALAEEEERRREAISRQAAEAGESEWVIDFGGAEPASQYTQPLVLADSSLDADDDDFGYGGRQLYGNFKRKGKANAWGEEAQEGQDGRDPESKSTKRTKPQRANLDEVTSISGAGGRRSFGGGMNEKRHKSQHKRKHK